MSEPAAAAAGGGDEFSHDAMAFEALEKDFQEVGLRMRLRWPRTAPDAVLFITGPLLRDVGQIS